jgi:hypothetical protein
MFQHSRPCHIGTGGFLYHRLNTKRTPKLNSWLALKQKVTNVFRALVANRTPPWGRNVAIRQYALQWKNSMESPPYKDLHLTRDFKFPQCFPHWIIYRPARECQQTRRGSKLVLPLYMIPRTYCVAPMFGETPSQKTIKRLVINWDLKNLANIHWTK